MAEITNPVFQKLRAAIEPVVSIGVGSALVTVCQKLKLDPEKLTGSDIPKMRAALLEHYSKFWAQKMSDITQRLNLVI